MLKIIVAIVGSLVSLKLIEKFMFPLIWVNGESMLPTYKPGDFFWATRIFSREKLKVGDVVIVKNPLREINGGHKYFVKRIAKISPVPFRGSKGSVFVLGDNRDNSNDSRNFGYIPYADVVAKAIKTRPYSV